MNLLKLLILLPIVLLITACPEDAPVKPDPCEGKKPVTSKIKVMQKLVNYTNNTTEWIETDTLPVGKQILFEADDNYSNYEWQILGDTTKYYNKQQIFKFDYIWGELTIRLVVRDKSDTLCFPNDDGIDTSFKKIFITNYQNLAINGIYEGYNVDKPNDTFDVEIKFEDGNRGMVMYNINRGCFVPQNKLPFSYYRLDFSNYCILFNGVAYGEGCEYPSGRGILDINNSTIVIDYEAGPQNDRKIYKFIGVKK